MGIKHELDLRAVGRQASEVAKLIDQGGQRPGGFQTTVNINPPRDGPDATLQSIQTQLESVAAAIELYLSQGAGRMAKATSGAVGR